MVESRYYSVADLVFSITSDPQQVVLPPNYAPFETAPVVSSDLLFALVIGSLPPMETEWLYTDTPAEDMPRIEVYRVKGSSASHPLRPRRCAPNGTLRRIFIRLRCI